MTSLPWTEGQPQSRARVRCKAGRRRIYRGFSCDERPGLLNLLSDVKPPLADGGTGGTPGTCFKDLRRPRGKEGFLSKAGVLVAILVHHCPQQITVGNPVRTLARAPPAQGTYSPLEEGLVPVQ